jgi:hypothetical protein
MDNTLNLIRESHQRMADGRLYHFGKFTFHQALISSKVYPPLQKRRRGLRIVAQISHRISIQSHSPSTRWPFTGAIQRSRPPVARNDAGPLNIHSIRSVSPRRSDSCGLFHSNSTLSDSFLSIVRRRSDLVFHFPEKSRWSEWRERNGRQNSAALWIQF